MMMMMTIRTSVIFLASIAAVIVVVQHVAVPAGYVSEPQHGQKQDHGSRRLAIEESSLVETNVSSSSSSSIEVELLRAMTEKLTTPRELALDGPSADNTTTRLAMHQFIHLHHMKTGGTSMDRYLECARNRLQSDKHYTIPYGNLHECSRDSYIRCKTGQDSRCQQNIAQAAMLSYCAPLKDLPSFSWGGLEHGINVTVPPSHGAITVLRDPVDRVWSMYRFRTMSCFQCKPLIDIYQAMDAGDMMNMSPTCSQQLQNHQVANLLSTEWLEENDATTTSNDDDARLAEAIKNMKSFFTVIGLTEHLEETIDIAGRVFAWMKPQVEWSNRPCALGHANASPQNNGCGPGRTHWELPDHPDEETRAAIEAHNQLDRKLYAAAVQHFELQKRALALDEEQN